MSQLIIGLGHKAQQGKDTFVAAIAAYYAGMQVAQRKHGLKVSAPLVQRVAFADALYEMARRDYGMVGKDAPLLQNLGQHMRIEHGENYWFDQAVKKMDPNAGIVIVSDVRYRNEADGLKKLGGIVVDIQRYNANGIRYIASDRPTDHPSEVELDHYAFDAIITNMSGHQALYEEQAITLVHYFRQLKGHK
jgi:hypothetical protein